MALLLTEEEMVVVHQNGQEPLVHFPCLVEDEKVQGELKMGRNFQRNLFGSAKRP